MRFFYIFNLKFFELTNHLGNVLVTVSDKRMPVSTDRTTVAYYNADVVTSNDYLVGGMQMPGRQYSSTNGYRYGFNGKEKDNKDGVVQYDYGFRIYDPRLVRFKSVDPLFKGYPWNSPYSYAEGDVIRSIDLDGKEKAIVTDDGTIEIQLVYVAFTNRPSKVIDGKEYSGGNLPSNLSADMAVKVFNKGYDEINSELNGKEFAIKPTEYAKPELSNGLYFGAKQGEVGDKTSKVRYSAKLLVFTDEDEMRKSNDYQQAVANNTMSGYQLYGDNSYGKIGVNANSEQPIVRDPDAWGQSFGSGTTPNKAILIDPLKGNGYPMQGGNAYYRSTVTHEDGHQLGLPHILPGDPVSGDYGSSLVAGDRYNGIGLMKGITGAHPAKAEAPFLTQLIKILSSIRFEKPAVTPSSATATPPPQ